jgi:hypothetical protein
MGFPLTGAASFASSVRVEMAGSSPAMTGVAACHDGVAVCHDVVAACHDGVAVCAVRQQLRRYSTALCVFRSSVVARCRYGWPSRATCGRGLHPAMTVRTNWRVTVGRRSVARVIVCRGRSDGPTTRRRDDACSGICRRRTRAMTSAWAAPGRTCGCVAPDHDRDCAASASCRA